MIRAVRALLIAVFCLCLALPAAAQERITNFVSDISIATNGVLTVRETISVQAENRRILHGIFRTFPTRYLDNLGNRHDVDFVVDQVLRDNQTEPYGVENIPNGKLVRIGSGNVTISPGRHNYTIVYRTDRQIGFFPRFDELYWNVTGNGWDFAIDRAEAFVHLPPGAMAQELNVYTGPQGAKEHNAQATNEGSAVRFVTTAPLASREGLTVSVTFNKGVVIPPTAAENVESFIRANAATMAALLGFGTLGFYYFAAWLRFGRDPTHGVIVPLFAPPKNFSAAAVRFVDRMGYDRKAFAAALIAMAVKGYLKISESWGTYTLTRTGKSEEQAGLQSTETAIARTLFGGRNEIELKNTNHTVVSRAITALRDALKREDEGVYFVTNSGWFFGGLVILVMSGVVAVVLVSNPAPAAFGVIFLAVMMAGLSHVFMQVYQAWRGFIAGPGSRVFNFIGAVFSTVLAVPAAGIVIFVLFFLNQSVPVATLIPLGAEGILAYVFYHLLKAPTLAGAKVRDEIDGFRMFLMTAEKDRLEVLHPPQVTPEVFEKFLPYAIALDAENAWSKKFEEEAARAGVAPADRSNYTPGWYSGSSFNRFGGGNFASAIGGAIAGATAAAATAPGSSSGSGGGGSSGGGGGGGGGGGW